MTTLHENASPRALGVLRAAVFLIWLGDLLRESFRDLAALPLEMFQPLGLLRLLPAAAWAHVFTLEFFGPFRVVLALLLVALMLGVGPYRLLAPVAWGLLIFWQGLPRGMVGNVHRELALLYVTGIIAFFPATDGFALRPPRRPAGAPALYRAPLMAATLVFCLTYVLVGVRRVTWGGPGIFLDDTILRYVVVRSAEPGFWSGGAGLAVLSHPWLARAMEIAFPVVMLFEIAAPLVLFSRRFRLAWAVVIVAFHFGSWSLMQIFFLQNLLLMPFLLLEIDPILAWLDRRWGRRVAAPAAA